MTFIFNEDKQQKRVSELRSKEAEDLAQILSQKYTLPYIDLSKLPINTDALRMIPEAEARAAQVAAFKVSGKRLAVGLTSPNNPATQKIIAELRDKNLLVEVFLCSTSSLERAFERYQEISLSAKTEAGVIDIANEEIGNFLQEVKNLDEVKDRLKKEIEVTSQTGGITSLLEIILASAIFIKASDIHIEPQENRARLRYRLDGVLNDFIFFDRKIYQPLLSRVKLTSGLKLNIKDAAQDGRFSIKLDPDEIEVRTAILPGAYGESIVLRLLNPATLLIEFTDLGLEPSLLETLDTQITKPNGLILLTGPTGAGKTTTLYTILRKLNSPATKIITIEDPIEYHLEGINQTQVDVDKHYTFLSGLRSALRQDPDIILVGEIRDQETAKIAVNASLTGHLVLSTLHTNNAAGVIPRLVDLGVDAKIIGSALHLALAQRLVRRLCLDCRQSYTPETEEKTLIEKIWRGVKEKRPQQVLAPDFTLWKSNGCPVCHSTGFHGRIGIFEALIMAPAISELLEQNPAEYEVRRLIDKQGLLNLPEDGIIKVVNGTTTLEELKRVVDLYEPVL